MKVKNLEDALARAPFVPFDVHIDGKLIRVEHPDQVLFNASRTTVVVAPSDDRFHIIDVDQIEFLTVHKRARAAKAS